MSDQRDELLWAQAGSVYPHSEYMREAWYKAVKFLRQGTRRGWVFDRIMAKTVDRPLLHGYVATPPLHIVKSLPDEQVVPSTKVTVGPWPTRT